MTRHPLAVLRTALGLSQSAYVQLVSDRRAMHGNGRMAARREKVARWESGRVTPDLDTQRAMAEIHDVPFADVLRLGWPRWLPGWSAGGSTGFRPVCHGITTFSGSRLASHVQRLLDTVTSSRPPSSPEGLAAWIDARVGAAEALRLDANPQVLLSAVEGDLGVVRVLVSRLDRWSADGAGTAAVHARTADLCGRLAAASGDHAGAEVYLLEAAAATASLGAAESLAAQLSNLAACHLRAGSPQDAHLLLHASRSAWPGLSGRLEVVTKSREARVHARLGERSAAVRAMELASAALAELSTNNRPNLAVIREVDEDWLGVSKALMWLQLEEPRRATREFESILGYDIPASPFRAPVWLLHPLVEAHLQVGDLEAAVWQVRRALSLLGWFPEWLGRQVKEQFAVHRHERIVRSLWADLDAPG
ncbi:hypothetical protein ACFVVX_15130 [Kitasatospora sp. NPDC058170]|uniref:hypothetical protein n=1 Tax=Kitasatospora sp. NPDC058170 TaxID=3346364 RepID=UPI0036DB587E